MTRKIVSEELDAEFMTFLNGMKESSRMTYKGMLRHWVNFSHMNGAETLEFRKKDTDALTQKKIVAFKDYLMKEKKSNGEPISENYARTATGAIRGFLSSHRLKCEFITSEKRRIQEANRSTEDYLFAKEDLVKMVEQANLTEKYVLLVGKSVGLRASDFLNFTYGQFRSIHIESEAPVSLGEIVTQKEHVRAFPFLDSDAVQVVKAILERDPEKKDSDKVLEWDEKSLTQNMQRLFEKAHLVSGEKRVRFHNLRKYLFDKLSCVMSEEKAKQIIGKKIREGAYLGIESLRECYERAMPSIIINGNGKNHVALEEMKNALAQAEDERRAEKTRREQTEKRLEEVLLELAKRETMSKGIVENEGDKILRKFVLETERNRKEKVPID